MKNILVIITGSIAAYKSATLVSRLQKSAHVRVIMTQSAADIITPLAMRAVCKQEVYLNHEISREKEPMLHIKLAQWADLMIIAPASAHTLARLTYGLADDLITTCYLATRSAVFIAPAMNTHMWQHPATSEQIIKLKQRGNIILGPAYGTQACGDTGPGCMLDVEDILKAMEPEQNKKPLAGMRIMINAGPTREHIDCMRFLSNRSSGKMGYAMAQAALSAGAQVTLITGPCHLEPPAGAHTINIETAEDMLEQCRHHAAHHAVFIAAAAIADYRPCHRAEGKIKRKDVRLTLELMPNPDIVKTIAQQYPGLVCIGFAAESENLIKHAKNKMEQKNLKAIIANKISNQQGAECDTNQATLITPNLAPINFDNQPKSQLAREIISALIEHHIIKIKEHSADPI